MRAWVAMLTVVAALAGCTSGETTDDAGDDLVVDARPTLDLVFQVTGNGSGEAPFTTTFSLGADVDLPNATYTILVARADGAGSDNAAAGGDNATAPDGGGDATAGGGQDDGNATEPAANGTDGAGEPTEALTGDGLPASFELTFEEPGTFTVHARVLAEGYQPADAVAGTDILVQAMETAGNATDAAENATSVPDPVVITGSAMVPNPLNSLRCLHDGIDGDMHDIAPAAEGWSYTLEPAADFNLYWFGDGGYLETGEDAGEVPPGATRVEVCSDTGVAGAEYTVTLTHPLYVG